MKSQVVHVDAEHASALSAERAILAEAGAELVAGGASTPEAIISAARDADVILTDSAQITRQVIEGLPECLAVVCYGIGFDHVDVQAATENGVFVVNMAGFCADEVANHTLMFILACARKLVRLDRDLRAGRWPDSRRLEAILSPVGSISGERLGLVGFGSIARLVAVKARALEMIVSAHDPAVAPAVFAEYGVQPATLEELIAESDYLSLHTPLSPETQCLLDEGRLRRMKRTAYLINTSRGAVVDECALVRALQEGWIAGAALDAFTHEPLPRDSPLLTLDGVVLTPHVGGYSDASFARLRRRVGQEAARVVRGEMPVSIVNPEVKGRSRLERRAEKQPQL